MKQIFTRRRNTDSVGFIRDTSGLAALEFALVLPIMLALYFGVVEVSRLTRMSQKVDQISDMLADMTSRKLSGGDFPGQAGITDEDLANMFKAAEMIIAPLPVNRLRIEIDELQAGDADRNPHPPRVRWYVSLRNSRHRICDPNQLFSSESGMPVDEFQTIPASIANTSNTMGFIVSARVQYDYGAAVSPVLFGKGSKLVHWSYKVVRVLPNGTINNPLILKATDEGLSVRGVRNVDFRTCNPNS